MPADQFCRFCMLSLQVMFCAANAVRGIYVHPETVFEVTGQGVVPAHLLGTGKRQVNLLSAAAMASLRN